MTPLAENKTYMKWSNYWDQLILHGAVPFLCLAFTNVKYVIFLRECSSSMPDVGEGSEPKC